LLGQVDNEREFSCCFVCVRGSSLFAGREERSTKSHESNPNKTIPDASVGL